MTREQLQTTADVIRTLMSQGHPGDGFTMNYERVLSILAYRFDIRGKVIEQPGEVYQSPNPQMAWYNSEGKELK